MAQPPDSQAGDGGMLACAVIELVDAIGTLTETLVNVADPTGRYDPPPPEPGQVPAVLLYDALRDLVAHHVRLMVANGWPPEEARRWAEEWFGGGE